MRSFPSYVRLRPGHGYPPIFAENARKDVEKLVKQRGEIIRRAVWDIHPRGYGKTALRTDDVQEAIKILSIYTVLNETQRAAMVIRTETRRGGFG